MSGGIQAGSTHYAEILMRAPAWCCASQERQAINLCRRLGLVAALTHFAAAGTYVDRQLLPALRPYSPDCSFNRVATFSAFSIARSRFSPKIFLISSAE